MAHLAISLFGGFRLTFNGLPYRRPVSEKGRALLAFLAIERDRPHSRSFLAGLLWPERPEENSLSNLRQNIHRLRDALGDTQAVSSHLLVSPHEIEFNCSSDCWLDVAEFDQAISAVHSKTKKNSHFYGECLERLRYAASLYKGDLLDGFSLTGCRQYEWWLLSKQEAYHSKAIEVLIDLVLHHRQEHDFRKALQYVQHALNLEPWSELLHRQKMELLAMSGQRVAALHQYEVCRKNLAEEQGIQPSEEIEDLYRQILKNTFSPGEI
jgi:DNA-binding SARP family transcriptional activator